MPTVLTRNERLTLLVATVSLVASSLIGAASLYYAKSAGDKADAANAVASQALDLEKKSQQAGAASDATRVSVRYGSFRAQDNTDYSSGPFPTFTYDASHYSYDFTITNASTHPLTGIKFTAVACKYKAPNTSATPRRLVGLDSCDLFRNPDRAGEIDGLFKIEGDMPDVAGCTQRDYTLAGLDMTYLTEPAISVQWSDIASSRWQLYKGLTVPTRAPEAEGDQLREIFPEYAPNRVPEYEVAPNPGDYTSRVSGTYFLDDSVIVEGKTFPVADCG